MPAKVLRQMAQYKRSFRSQTLKFKQMDKQGANKAGEAAVDLTALRFERRNCKSRNTASPDSTGHRKRVRTC